MQTRVANIGKEDFPKLLAELWDCTFKDSHLHGGFHETGLFPFNFEAIPSWKVAPALPLQATSSTQVPASETPLRTKLRKCFTEALKPTKTKVTKPRKKVNVIHNGE